LRHLKRNHTEQADGELTNVRRTSSDNCEASSSKQLQGEVSSDEEEWLSEDPDITLEDEPESSEMCRDMIKNSSSSVQRPIDQDERVVVDAITRKRTQPLPVFTPSKAKAPRQQDNVIIAFVLPL
jgi:hypothetical protein